MKKCSPSGHLLIFSINQHPKSIWAFLTVRGLWRQPHLYLVANHSQFMARTRQVLMVAESDKHMFRVHNKY